MPNIRMKQAFGLKFMKQMRNFYYQSQGWRQSTASKPKIKNYATDLGLSFIQYG
jgi:hypothetical protein